MTRATVKKPARLERERQKTRRREEKCENRKNYVLRTGCPMSGLKTDFGFGAHNLCYIYIRYIACAQSRSNQFIGFTDLS